MYSNVKNIYKINGCYFNILNLLIMYGGIWDLNNLWNVKILICIYKKNISLFKNILVWNCILN